MFKDVGRLLINVIRDLAWIMFRESAKTSIAKALLVYLIANKKRLHQRGQLRPDECRNGALRRGE